MSIAICGLGRAGNIHTGNCVQNPRVHIKYFVEVDVARAEEVKQKFGLKDTIVVHADDFQKVQGSKYFTLNRLNNNQSFFVDIISLHVEKHFMVVIRKVFIAMIFRPSMVNRLHIINTSE